MPRTSPFPPISLEESLVIARTIWNKNAGKPMRRLTLFDTLGRSPGSGTSRQLLTASVGYGLTKGSYKAETIQLTERGEAIAKDNSAQARLEAVTGVDVFRAFFEHYSSATVPSDAAALDFLKELEIPEKSTQSCLEVLLKSGEQVALVQEISGAKRIVSAEHALDTLKSANSAPLEHPLQAETVEQESPSSAHLSTEAKTGTKRLPSLNINIQIHLPSDAKPETYATIFRNIREHLMDEE